MTGEPEPPDGRLFKDLTSWSWLPVHSLTSEYEDRLVRCLSEFITANGLASYDTEVVPGWKSLDPGNKLDGGI